MTGHKHDAPCLESCIIHGKNSRGSETVLSITILAFRRFTYIPHESTFERGLAEYHVSQEDGEIRASFIQVLKRFVACLSVLDKRRRSILKRNVGHYGTA